LAVPAAAAWVTAALLVRDGAGPARWVCVCATASAVLAVVRRRRWPLAIAVGVAAAGASTGVHLAALTSGPVADLTGRRSVVDAQLRLVRDPVSVQSRSRRRLVVADATVTAVRRASSGQWLTDHAPVVVFGIDPGWLGLLPGQRVSVTGRIAAPRPGDAVSAVLVVAGAPKTIGRPPLWQRLAGRVRERLRDACVGLPDDERGLVPGLVLGDVAGMPSTLTSSFRVTGLAHLTAVSGANVAIVLGAVLSAVRWSGLGRRSRSVAAAAALLGFVVLARPSPSVLRAAVMGAVVLLAGMTGRRSRALPALAAAVLSLIVVDPFLARSPGFAMSVLATGAIVTIAPAWTARLSEHLPRPVAAALAVPAAAQLACTPVIVATFGQLTPYAVPANLLAAPAVAPATLAGIAAAIAGVVVPPLAQLLAWLAGLPAAWLVLVARTGASLPGAGLGWPTGAAGVGALALCASAVTAACAGVRRRRRAILGRCPV
jgi:competence protein ComEC